MNMSSPSIALAATAALMAACKYRRGWSLSPRDVIGERVEVRLRDGHSLSSADGKPDLGTFWACAREHCQLVTGADHVAMVR